MRVYLENKACRGNKIIVECALYKRRINEGDEGLSVEDVAKFEKELTKKCRGQNMCFIRLN